MQAFTRRLSWSGKKSRLAGLFCDGIPVATKGGAGTQPFFAANHPTRIHALFGQGYRDGLFNFNDNYANYQCLKSLGGDVRLITCQAGHNTFQVVPDPDQAWQPLGNVPSAD